MTHYKFGCSEAPTLLLRSLNFVLQPLGGVSRSSSSVEFRLILVENAVERNIVLHVRHVVEMFVTHITLARIYVNGFVGHKGGDDCGAEGGCKVGGVRGVRRSTWVRT